MSNRALLFHWSIGNDEAYGCGLTWCPPLFTTLILPCGMPVENAEKEFVPPREQASTATFDTNSYNRTAEPPVEEPDRLNTPNVVIHEDEDGHFEVVASGEEAIEKYNDRFKEKAHRIPARPDGKVELTHEMALEATGFAFPAWKKWYILCVVFLVQVSMNFNTSIYPNATALIPEDKDRYGGVSPQGARASQMIFLIAYAFGSELWAPWSEELGRWPVMQLSLFLVNITQIWCRFSQNYDSLLAARFFGGLCTAGGSVTLGMVADLYDSDDHQYAIAFIVLSSVIGTSIGPVIGGLMQGFMSDPVHCLNWIIWLMLIFGGFTQLVHALTVPETLSFILIDREARRRRKARQEQLNGTLSQNKKRGISFQSFEEFWLSLHPVYDWFSSKPERTPQPGDENIYGPIELKENRFSAKEVAKLWFRPFHMIATEPIVLFLSLLSGFSDALIFTFEMSFDYVFKDGWGFKPWAVGLAFISINVGYIIAFFSFFPTIMSQRRARRIDPDCLYPEVRLWWLLWLAPLEPIGLFGFAWCSYGEPQVHWIAPLIFAVLIAIANYAIYMATIDYMVEAYGEYSASATGGNALARDLLAGISAMYAVPMYEKISPSLSYQWASTFLGFVSIVVIIPIYVFYWKGPQIRERSPFSLEILKRRKEERLRAKGEMEEDSGANQKPGEKSAASLA